MLRVLWLCIVVGVSSERQATWIARPLSDALWGFAPNSSVNPECKRQSQLYAENLKNGTLWAVQMLESSALAPQGVLMGNSYQLGQFDECVALNVPNYNIRGKYCLPKIHISPDRTADPNYYTNVFQFDPFGLYYPPDLPVWTKIKKTPDPSKVHKDELVWAICMPASCSAEDLLYSLNETLTQVFKQHNINGSVYLDEWMCYAEEPYTMGFTILSIFLGVTLSIVIIATTYDLTIYRKSEASKHPKGSLLRVTLAYSAYRNLISLKKPDSSSELSVMHGMRMFSMCLVILGHRCVFSYGGPLQNGQFLESRYRKFQDSFLLNGTIIVDTFFILSGFLTCYMIYMELEKRRRLTVIPMYIYRWLRITPTYMFMVAFYALILPQIGDGPFWESRAGLEAQRCQENWWANLLFINNYVNTNQLCMFQSWFITCDMHYFLVAPFIVYLLWKHPKVGMSVLFVLFCLATLIPTLITYYKGYDGVLKVYINLIKDPTMHEQYYNFYIKTHNRAIPYIVGMAAAYLYVHLKTTKFQISMTQIRLGGVVTTILGLSAVMVAYIFYIPGYEIDPIFHALYSSLHRVIWAIPMCWLIIIGGLQGFGVLNNILSLRAYIPLSRLTYCAFLIHGFVQIYTTSSVRNPQYMSFPIIFWMAFGDIFVSFLLALILYLLFEAPIASIQKMLLRPNKPYEHKAKDTKTETNLAFTATEPPHTTINLNTLEANNTKIPRVSARTENQRL